MTYVLTCASGTEVLVAASTAEQAERDWDKLAAAGEAEERITGFTRRASRADVRYLVEQGRDYR